MDTSRSYLEPSSFSKKMAVTIIIVYMVITLIPISWMVMTSFKNVDSAISWKQEFSKRTDASMAIATQFCFDADVVKQWADNIKKDGIDIPIHIGIAGPAKLQTLLKFSVECGIGASMKVLTKRAKDLTKLLLPYEPTKILQDLSDFKSKDPYLNIEKVHFFPIGGIKKTVDWVAEMHDQNAL